MAKSSSSSSNDFPESTLESANRRDFVKKVALGAAAVGAGTALLGGRTIPESSARSDNTSVTTCTSNQAGRLAVWGCPSPSTSLKDTPCTNYFCVGNRGASLCGVVDTVKTSCINPLGAVLTVSNAATCLSPVGLAGLTEVNSCPTGLTFYCWPSCYAAGVVGSAVYGNGVVGSSKKGISVLGAALHPAAVPIVAQGATGQKSNLQEWGPHISPDAVVAANGYFGIGTPTPQTLLDVNGTILGSKLGLGTFDAKTTLEIDGSISARAVTPTTAYVMGAADFAVLANPSAGAFMVTLPPANTATGMIVFIKKTDTGANSVTVQGAGSGSTQDKIEAVTSLALSGPHSSLTLISNGAAPPGMWLILSKT